MTMFIPRTLSYQQDGKDMTCQPAAWRDKHAYILLGNAGMGKSELFKHESEVLGDSAIYVSVQDFVDLFGHKTADELQGKTLFIDGLDEARSQDGQSVVSSLRQLLSRLGSPRFRLSCRAEEWLGKVDHDSFSKLLPTGQELLAAHLQPFTRDDVFTFLQGKGIDAEQFYQQAERSNLHDLLGNPQMLGMLVEVVETNKGWPQSKKEVYEMACRQLVTEHNDMHQQHKSQHPDKQLLLAAGYWYATLLLSGRRVATLGLPESDRLLSLNKTVGFADQSLPLADVLKTRLFLANGDGEFGFVHRSIAEFLAALYIADCLENGLPLMRVWSLLCIERGVVSHLRGLYGWLTSLAGAGVRRDLMALDPLALLVYGDARHFSRADKTWLVDVLGRQIRDEPNFMNQDVSYREIYNGVGTLATADMEEAFASKLESIGNDHSERKLARMLLKGIEHGCFFPSLQSRLLDMVRESQLPSYLRNAALYALLAHSANLDVSLGLLESFRTGQIHDPCWEMVDAILMVYYPSHITPENVLNYFHPYDQPEFESFSQFWFFDFFERTPDESLPVLLTTLTAMNKKVLSNCSARHELDTLARKMLERTLVRMGDSLPVTLLAQWLLVDFDYSQRQAGGRALDEWAKRYPARYQDLMLHVLGDSNSQNPLNNLFELFRYIHQPDWLWLWVIVSLNKAQTEQLRVTLFDMALFGLELPNAPYDLNVLYDLSCRYPELTGKLDDLYCTLSEDNWQRDNHVAKQRQLQRENNRRAQNRDRFLAIREALADGTADLQNLAWLAIHYWNAFPYRNEPAKNPLEILTEELNGDAELAGVCLQALRTVLQRPDLPGWQTLLENSYEGKSACLAALQDMYLHSSEHLLTLPDDTLRLAVVLVLFRDYGERCDWYESLKTRRPDICADVYGHYFQLVIKSDWDASRLKSLVRNDYAAVSKLLIPELFATLPQSLSDSMWESIPYLWCAGVRHTEDHAAQTAWLQQQLQVVQTDERMATLLVMSLMLDPASHATQTKVFVQTDVSTRHFATALVKLDECMRLDLWPSDLLGHCIQQLGSVFPPPVYIEGAHRSPDNDKSRFVVSMLTMLSRCSDGEAVTKLGNLYEIEELAEWRDEVKYAMAEQRKTRRHALFQALTPGQIVSTLKGKAPSSIADLQALVMHELGALAKQIRDGSGDAYKQFWSEDQFEHVTKPKNENSCRNVLSLLLKERFMRMNVSIIEERQHAETNRADLCFEYAALKLKLSIEVKRSNHAKLWTAVSEQLVPRYARDPESHGHGIFLVFWFGKDYVTSRGRNQKKPEIAAELGQMLNDALSEHEKQTIRICVIDVAKPE